MKRGISRVIRTDKALTTLPPLLAKPRRILLITPPGTIEESYGRLSSAAGELPMLGLAYIAAALRDQGNTVRIIDYEANGRGIDSVAADIRDFAPDIIGMTAYITNMRRCVAVASIAKTVMSDVTIILGGPQVTIFPEEAFTSPHIDMIVLSEGEIIIRNVINALGDEDRLRAVAGIWFRASSGEIVRNPRGALVDDIDLLPPPALDLFDMEKYYPPAHIRGRRVAHLMTSRGCPFKCTFCETKLTFGRSFRFNSTGRVLADLERLIAAGYRSFQFYDDIFTINRKRVLDLCRSIIARGWKIQWMCFTRTNTVNDELLAVMKEAGCYLITYGCESGDDELLRVIQKDLTVARNREAIALTRRHGIRTMSSFMLGLPTETPEQSLKTIDFALTSGLDYAVFPITEPYPGTELWVDAHRYGRFDDSGNHTNNLLSEHSAVWIPNGRTREELEGLAVMAMRRFYLRPRILLQSLGNFLVLPWGRAIRFLWAGFKLFVLEARKESRPGTRY
ncbi:MAG: B12-binding domain-containing radical SAM protein [Alphaproteobacteria bacterium]